MGLVEALAARARPAVSRAAGTGCAERRIAISGRIRKGKVVSLIPVTTNPRTTVRYTCKAAAGGRIMLIVDGRRSPFGFGSGAPRSDGRVPSGHAPVGCRSARRRVGPVGRVGRGADRSPVAHAASGDLADPGVRV